MFLQESSRTTTDLKKFQNGDKFKEKYEESRQNNKKNV